MPSPAAIHSVLRLGRMALFAAGEDPEPINSPALWWKLGISACLILAGGVFAGLTLGLMGLDELHLRVLSVSSDDEKERENARVVLDLLKKGRHWVLVSLLLSNVVVNESLPIFLDSAIGGGIAAVAISTTMIVIFGVIPQAICARYGLVIGARCAKFVLGLMWLLSPIAYPTAKLLDRVLGAAEENTYKKAELRTFLQFHRQGEEPLRDDEIAILNGVLSLNETQVAQIMTPMKDVFTLEQNDVLDHAMVDKLLLSGYSRVPVHEAGAPLSFVGLLLLKKLLTYDPSQCKKVSDFALSLLPEAAEDINCFQALDYFQTGRAHLLLISKTPGEPGGAIGVITLEDVIEEIIAEEIVDEFDQYESNSSKRRAKRMSTAAVMKGIVERNLNKQTEGPRPVNESTKLVHSNGNGKAPANYSSTS
ncbi:DUF21-domain-containing protein [Exidia glandulosa HHB12029]|uniref:DUF21-domain-containing protein n=1 Tax=Exidia glandulosa HHB12029 TaxID=1314781 RepID=A0A165BEV0_EXIGL|nr:DUF21-domain-containing protein [Exidia glandulosa HHB12029]